MTKDESPRTVEKLQEAEREERERSAPTSSGEDVEKLNLTVSSCSNAGSHSSVIADQRGGLSDEEQNNSPPQAKGKTSHSRPLCSVGRCNNFARDEGVCIRHGATPSSKSQSRARKKCVVKGCDSFARSRGGVCLRHGATASSRKMCSREGCTNQAQRGGVCRRHRSRRPHCSHEGCTSYAQNGDVCARHGASDDGGGAKGNALEELVDATWGVWEKSEKIRGPDDAGDRDDEDKMGALVYDSSDMARDWADEIELSTPVCRHPLVSSAQKRPSNSDLLCDDASQLISGDGLSPQSIGDSEDFAQIKSAAKRKASASLAVDNEAKRAKLLPTPKKSAKNAVSSAAVSEEKKATKKKPNAKEKKKKYSMRPFNRYNIFFIFEREKILQSKGHSRSSRSVSHHASSRRDAEEESQLMRENYGNLRLPPLPPRFAGLPVPDGWFIPRSQKGKMRLHRKTRGGVEPFLSLVKSIAKAWKEVDRETLEWTMVVEKALRQNQMRQLLQEGENHSVENAECGESAEIQEGVWSESPHAQPVKLAAETKVQSKLPAGTGVIHDEEMTHDNHAPPSPVTSKDEFPSSATLKHTGHFEGELDSHEKSGVEHLGPKISSAISPVAPATDRAVESTAPDAARPVADDEPRSKEEKLRTWMVDYFKNSSSTFNDATDPANAEAALHDDTLKELRKYLSVMKCAEVIREKAAREIRQRIIPRLLLLSNSAGDTEWWKQLSRQSGAHADRPVPPTTGNDVSNSTYYNPASPTQRMLAPEHVGSILEIEQEPRILEEVHGGNIGDGAPFVADREEGR